jgi:hypothetical protein
MVRKPVQFHIKLGAAVCRAPTQQQGVPLSLHIVVDDVPGGWLVVPVPLLGKRNLLAAAAGLCAPGWRLPYLPKLQAVLPLP